MKVIENKYNGEIKGFGYTDAEWVTECNEVHVDPIKYKACMYLQINKSDNLEKRIQHLVSVSKCDIYTVRHVPKGIAFYYKRMEVEMK